MSSGRVLIFSFIKHLEGNLRLSVREQLRTGEDSLGGDQRMVHSELQLVVDGDAT